MFRKKRLGIDALAARARALKESGNVELEIEAWQACLKLADSREAHKRLYQILAERGDHQAARHHLEKLAPTHPSWRNLLVKVELNEAIKAGQYDRVTEQLQRLVTASPDDVSLWQWLARAATLAGKNDAAADAWTRVKSTGSEYMEDEYDARIEAARSGIAPTVAILGNCQVYPIARFLRQMTGASVITVAPRDFIDPTFTEIVSDEIARCKFVVSQPLDTKGWGELRTEILRRKRPDLVMMPSILFTGWQPDLMHLPPEQWSGPKHTFVEFHSRLTLAAFLCKVPEDRVIDLFNSYIFARLGYFDEYSLAKRFLLDLAADLDFDLSEDMHKWEQSGPFMHTPNHPDVPVLWSFARKLADKMKLSIDNTASPPAEYFRINVWPLYPDLAKRHGLPGSLMFRPPKQPAIHLRELIATDYAAYARTDLSKIGLSYPSAAVGVLTEIGVGS